MDKIGKILHGDSTSLHDSQVYQPEADPKHPDSWEHVNDTWVRHHKLPRKIPFVPSGSPGGPDLSTLSDVRLTERCYPDGTVTRHSDSWTAEEEETADSDLWRGKTVFFTKPKEPTPTDPAMVCHAQVKPPVSGGRVRKLVEICTYTMMMTAAALSSTTQNWVAMTPISIEQGFDLLTPKGRDDAERYLKQEAPDLIIAEWMCDPWCSMQSA